MNFPPKYLKAIQQIYNNPTFAVKQGANQSNWKKQTTSIRQGCPLSPYLFIVVMTVIFRDVDDGLNLSSGKVQGLDFCELMYADDTALITNNVNAMNRLLTKIEKCALYHGLGFNKAKCVSMNFHCTEKTKYADGTRVPCHDSITYLGAELSKTHKHRRSINTKISQCIVIMNKLQRFWSNPNCPTKFKLQIYDLVIRSKLVYGLEGLELTTGDLAHLNAFQLKGLRRILKMKTTFVDRGNTNAKVFEKANAMKNPTGTQGKNIVAFSKYIHQQQNKLLAHTVRAPPEDPLRQCTLVANSAIPYQVDNRRVGRPKNNWTYSTYERLVKNNLGISHDLWKVSPHTYITAVEPAIRNKSIRT